MTGISGGASKAMAAMVVTTSLDDPGRCEFRRQPGHGHRIDEGGGRVKTRGIEPSRVCSMVLVARLDPGSLGGRSRPTPTPVSAPVPAPPRAAMLGRHALWVRSACGQSPTMQIAPPVGGVWRDPESVQAGSGIARLAVVILLPFLLAGGLSTIGGCTRLPAGWFYVTDVTSAAATVVWTGDEIAGVRCHGEGSADPPPPTLRRSGLRYVRIDGLVPDRPYVCRLVGVDGSSGVRVRFRTAPDPGVPFTFAAVGDSGDGSLAARRIARRILAARPAFLVHLGDLAYPRGTPAEMDERFFGPYRRVLARVPLYPTPGNHDLTSSGAYPEAFWPVPGDRAHDGLHYGFDWAGVRFLAVSYTELREGRTGGAAWLRSALDAAAGRPWRIVFLHEPVYTTARKQSVAGLPETLQPVLEEGRADLVLAGHIHLYERALPACTRVPEARVLSIVSGGGGDAALDRPRAHPNFPRALAVPHFVRVTVRPERIDAWAIGMQGQILDHVHHHRDGRERCRADGWPQQGDSLTP